jgi:serine protease Do
MFRVMLLAMLALSFCCQGPTPDSRPAQEALAGVEVLELQAGCLLQGRVLRSTEQTILLDVGFDVLKVPVASVLRRRPLEAAGTRPSALSQGELVARADLPERSVKEGASMVGEAVVKIESARGQGSGFVVHEDGWVVTNFHVVEKEVSVDVVVYSRDQSGFRPRTLREAKVLALNPEMDLALVKVERPADLVLKRVYLGDSDALKVGDPVYAIGAPIGLDRTVSSGIVSVTNRTFEGRTHLQITTPINPGNSGGPLFNLRTEVVGVNSSGYVGLQGLNFAIPSKYVIDFLKNRDAYALDTTRSENGVHYLPAPRKPRGGTDK